MSSKKKALTDGGCRLPKRSVGKTVLISSVRVRCTYIHYKAMTGSVISDILWIQQSLSVNLLLVYIQ